MMQESSTANVGDHLRGWRQRRRLSQLDCALEADISQRHLSFLETGRARPSRDMLIHLADRLDIPLRERNAALLAAGFAPAYPEHGLGDPGMAAARSVLEKILKGHEPYPALAVDRHWHLIHANAAVAPLLAGIAAEGLLVPPVNLLRLSLHPGGLAPRIANLGEWTDHLLHRLRRQIAVTQDPVLGELHDELLGYSGEHGRHEPDDGASLFVPLRLETPGGTLSFISTTTIFGTPRDVLLSEIAIEAFFPADEETERAFASYS